MKRYNITIYDDRKPEVIVGEYEHAYDYQVGAYGVLIVYPNKHLKEVWPQGSYTFAEIQTVKVKRSYGGAWDGP